MFLVNVSSILKTVAVAVLFENSDSLWRLLPQGGKPQVSDLPGRQSLQITWESNRAIIFRKSEK